jgi:hypothetical protein
VPSVTTTTAITVVAVDQAPRITVVAVDQAPRITVVAVDQAPRITVVPAGQGLQGPRGGGGLIETGPVFTYVLGVLSRINYDSGNYKTLTYSSGRLDQLDYVAGSVTTRKTFAYNPDGSLASIDQTVL